MRTIGILLLLVINYNAFSQAQASKSEFGFGLGVLNYTGDLSQNIKPRYFRPGATAYYRTNISNATSFRASLMGGMVTASDSRAPVDSFAVVRDHEFDVYVIEASGVIEYHFFNWKDNANLRWTPLVFGGLGLFSVLGSEVKKEYSSIQPVIPFGIGAKYVMNPRHMLEFQFGIRKTFFDYLDNVSEGDLTQRDFQYGNWYDNDTYYFLAITFTVSFYDIPCPKFPYN